MKTNRTTIDNDKVNNDKQEETSEKEMWTVGEAAEYLNVCEGTIRRDINIGELPYLRIRECIRLPKQAVLGWVKDQTRYNARCAGSVVQEKSTCHINAKTVRTGGRRSPTQAAKELDALLEPPTARKRKH